MTNPQKTRTLIYLFPTGAEYCLENRGFFELPLFLNNILPRIKMIEIITKGLLSFLFPKTCYYCQKEGRYLCSDCIHNYVRINWEQKCHVCGKFVSKGFTHMECKEFTHLDGLIYFTLYDEKIKEMIRDIKYNFYFDILKELAQLMSEYMKIYKFEDDLVLTDVPLHKRKKRYRGFNQSEILAKEISKLKGFKFLRTLQRIEDTKTQVGLSKDDREDNLRKSFSIMAHNLPSKIMLIDDVYTTGTTLNQCAKVLKESGVKEVYGYVFAKSGEQ